MLPVLVCGVLARDGLVSIMLRDYQGDLTDAAREGLRLHRSFMIQLPTGGGKTPIEAEIINKTAENGHRVWIIAPRNELLDQIGNHLVKAGVKHSYIRAGMNESRAFPVHIVSKQTLDRRWGRVKAFPHLALMDEAHLNFDFQKELFLRMPDETKLVGLTATPERTDGTGLKEKWIQTEGGIWQNLGGIWGGIAYGPSIPWLTEREFLAPLRYYAPPIEGLDKLHWRSGEVDADELDELLERRKVYGDVVKYYRKYGVRADSTKRPALIFCRSVKSAKETARQFEEAGFKFLPIWGGMPKNERDAALSAIRAGRIDGLTNCDLATYGLDVPNLEYMASIRPTQSRALYFQMVGRGLRPSPGKLDAVFFDHVNMVRDHQDERYPGKHLFDVEDVQWNFEGRVKRSRSRVEEKFMALCAAKDFQYCTDSRCRNGCILAGAEDADPRRGALEVDETIELVEIKKAVKFSDLAPEEKRDVQDRIGRAVEAAIDGEGKIQPGPIGELLALAVELGRSKKWVYHVVQDHRKALAVNVPLIYEIVRQAGWKQGAAWMWIKQLREGIKEGVLV